MNMKKYLYLIFIGVLILTSCSTSDAVDKATPASTTAPIEEPYPVGSSLEANPYPMGSASSLENQYPAGTSIESAYPIDTNKQFKQGPNFTIDEPVRIGSKLVTGTGPAGVPIRLVNITNMGEELAFTTIDKDGKYVFNLKSGLVSGDSIGLQIGDLDGTEYGYDEFLYNPQYYDKPMIGIIFYIVVVSQ